MKKIFVSILCLIVLLGNVSAKTENDSIKNENTKKEKTEKNNKPKFNHWSIAANVGFGMLDGDRATKMHQIIPQAGVDVAVGASVEYMINPVWGFYLQYNYLPYRAEKVKVVNGLAHEATVNGTINLLNLFHGCRRSGKWNLYFNFGAGTSFYKAKVMDAISGNVTESEVGYDELAYCMTFPLGVSVEYAPLKWLSIYMAADYRIHTEDDFDGLYNEIGNMFPDNIGNMGIGVRWLIGGQNANRPHVKTMSLCEVSPRKSEKDDKLDDLEKRLSALEKKINDEISPAVDTLNSVVFAKDSDGDGVPDSRDRHPNTPDGAFVNYYGEPFTADQISTMMAGINGKDGKDGKDGQSYIPSIYFDHNSTFVTAYSNAIIADIARKLYENEDLILTISGYCDMTGTEGYNEILSKKRAQTVRDILVNKYGLDGDRIKITGKGRTKGPKDSFMPNRRCDFEFNRK